MKFVRFNPREWAMLVAIVVLLAGWWVDNRKLTVLIDDAVAQVARLRADLADCREKTESAGPR